MAIAHSSFPGGAVPSLPPHAVPAPVAGLWTALAAAAPTYLVGGALRDLLRGVPPHDWDLATALPPEAIRAWAEAAGVAAVGVGARFGVVRLLPVDGPPVDVATFRRDGPYRDGRRPEAVTWADSIEEDLARRDFTVNALAAAPDGRLVDPYGGMRDLADRVVRPVGRAAARIREDPLRLWRAARMLAWDGGWRAAAEWEQAAAALGPLVRRVSAERQRDELRRLLGQSDGIRGGLEAAWRWGLLGTLWPEWAAVERRPGGQGALMHLLATASWPGGDEVSRLGGLLHALAAPGGATPPTHPPDGSAAAARLARTLLMRCRLPREVVAEANWLVEHQDTPWEVSDAVWRRRRREWGEPALVRLLWLQDACRGAAGCPGHAAAVRERLAALDGALVLAVNGRDVMAWRGLSGASVGAALRAAWAWVDEDPRRNRRECLRRFLEGWEEPPSDI